MDPKRIAGLPANTKNALLEYEYMLRVGKPARMPQSYFTQTDECNEKTAIEIFKYAFEEILHWTPEDAYNRLDQETITSMRLSAPYSYLRFPRELSKRDSKKNKQPGSFFYVAALCYPDRIRTKWRDLIIDRYRAVCSKRNGKFPKEYFSDADGETRARVCLQYVLSHEHVFNNAEEQYEFFGDKAKATAFLKKYRLNRALELLYLSPLDYLHASLPSSQRNELLYANEKFKAEMAQHRMDPGTGIFTKEPPKQQDQ